jgi:hypothetical protein
LADCYCGKQVDDKKDFAEKVFHGDLEFGVDVWGSWLFLSRLPGCDKRALEKQEASTVSSKQWAVGGGQ